LRALFCLRNHSIGGCQNKKKSLLFREKSASFFENLKKRFFWDKSEQKKQASPNSLFCFSRFFLRRFFFKTKGTRLELNEKQLVFHEQEPNLNGICDKLLCDGWGCKDFEFYHR
jgi:hypothetical protein